jgi:hypothetical protein
VSYLNWRRHPERSRSSGGAKDLAWAVFGAAPDPSPR